MRTKTAPNSYLELCSELQFCDYKKCSFESFIVEKRVLFITYIDNDSGKSIHASLQFLIDENSWEDLKTKLINKQTVSYKVIERKERLIIVNCDFLISPLTYEEITDYANLIEFEK